MSDLISREDAIDAIGVSWGLFDARQRVHALPSAETTGALDDAIAKYVADGYMLPPSAEAVEVVRCKDCRMTMERDEYIGRWWCSIHRGYMEDTYYCADGLRRGGDGE